MFAVLYALGMFIADLFKSRSRLEAELSSLRHQLNVCMRRPVSSSSTARNQPFCMLENPFWLPAQPVDATQALNLSAGVSNSKVSRGRSLS